MLARQCRSRAGITLDEEDVPHLLEALQANGGERDAMMFQLAESDEFTLPGSFKFSSDARNASLSAAADMEAEDLLDDMLRVTLPDNDAGMFHEDIDGLRDGADAEVTIPAPSASATTCFSTSRDPGMLATSRAPSRRPLP